MCPNRHSPDYPIQDSVNRHSIPHLHTVTVNKVSSRLTDKDSQPPVYQVGLGQRMYTSGGFMGHVVHLPPIPQHPRTPGHKAFRSQLTANELGGIRFAGVGPKMVHLTTQISQSQPPLTTKGSGDLGSISSHEDPTPIGDTGCPWE